MCSDLLSVCYRRTRISADARVAVSLNETNVSRNVGLSTNHMKLMNFGLIAALLGLAFDAGCASTPTSSNTSALQVKARPGAPSGQFTTITIMAFTLGTNVHLANRKLGENLAGDIVSRLRADYPGLFQAVRWNKSIRVPNEVILEGTISRYEPGSAETRAELIGTGIARFEGTVLLRDAQDGRVLLSAPFDKLWAWGGLLGLSKNINNMVAETSVAITKTVAHWKQGKITGK